MKKLMIAVTLVSFSISNSALAAARRPASRQARNHLSRQPSSVDLKEAPPKSDTANNETHGTWFFFAADGGFQHLSTNGGSDPSKSGYRLGPKLNLSWYWQQFVFDIGPAWYYSRIKGTNDAGFTYRIRNWAYAVEASPRYRLGAWQIGPIVRASFGTDVTLAPTIGANDHLYEVGLNVLRDQPWNSWSRWRWGGGVLTDINSPSRINFVAQLSVQWGFRILHPVDRPGEIQRPIEPKPVERELELSELAPEPSLIVEIPSQRFFFITNRDQLTPASKAYARRLGALLKQKSADWERIDIGGHTDDVGSYDYNLDLSQRRAETTMRMLSEAGIEGEKVTAHGYSFSQPKAPGKSPEARAQNRRVEMKFFGVPPGSTLKRDIESLDQRDIGPQI